MWVHSRSRSRWPIRGVRGSPSAITVPGVARATSPSSRPVLLLATSPAPTSTASGTIRGDAGDPEARLFRGRPRGMERAIVGTASEREQRDEAYGCETKGIAPGLPLSGRVLNPADCRGATDVGNSVRETDTRIRQGTDNPIPHPPSPTACKRCKKAALATGADGLRWQAIRTAALAFHDSNTRR